MFLTKDSFNIYIRLLILAVSIAALSQRLISRFIAKEYVFALVVS